MSIGGSCSLLSASVGSCSEVGMTNRLIQDKWISVFASFALSIPVAPLGVAMQ